jgi:epoxyqueuosine reductase
MLSRDAVIAKARELDFADVGFTTAEPFTHQQAILEERREAYAWATARGLDLMAGVDPARVLPGARSIIVLLELYFSQAFPRGMESHFGRCYLDDDRMTKDGLSLRIKAIRAFLKDHGLKVEIPYHLSHRLAAARAGLGDFGKNCLFYSHRVARGGSWVLPIALVVDAEFEPGRPTMEVGCPDWCKNACLTACPTGALHMNGNGFPHIARALCSDCMQCAAACGHDSLVVWGRVMSSADVMAEVINDKPFYKHSGGGLTVSGG